MADKYGLLCVVWFNPVLLLTSLFNTFLLAPIEALQQRLILQNRIAEFRSFYKFSNLLEKNAGKQYKLLLAVVLLLT